MNERIKDFVGQAKFMAEEELNRQISHNAELKVFAEKLAGLLLKECVATLMEMHLWQSVNNQNYPATWHDAVDTGIETIKEHFGVEE